MQAEAKTSGKRPPSDVDVRRLDTLVAEEKETKSLHDQDGRHSFLDQVAPEQTESALYLIWLATRTLLNENATGHVREASGPRRKHEQDSSFLDGNRREQVLELRPRVAEVFGHWLAWTLQLEHHPACVADAGQ